MTLCPFDIRSVRGIRSEEAVHGRVGRADVHVDKITSSCSTARWVANYTLRLLSTDRTLTMSTLPSSAPQPQPHGASSASGAAPNETGANETGAPHATRVERAERLKSIRPSIPVDTDDSRAVEQFQHEVLRPILKLLNPVLLDLIAHTLAKYGTGFTNMDRPEQVRRLENLLGQDSRLKRTLLGMAMGHFTQDEFARYLQDSGEIRRRMVELVTERARSQMDAIVERIESIHRE